jgi:hypothetical protein
VGREDHPQRRDDPHHRAVTAVTAGPDWVDEPDPIQETDFLEFWAEQQAKATTRTVQILGADVRVPTDVPLRLQVMAQQMDGSESVELLRQVLAELFAGVDHYDTWVEHGLTANMLKVIIAWAVTNGAGTPTSFARAVELSAAMEKADAEAAQAGKAPGPNRSARRASSRIPTSASSGRSSSRTSAASTGSRRRASGT